MDASDGRGAGRAYLLMLARTCAPLIGLSASLLPALLAKAAKPRRAGGGDGNLRAIRPTGGKPWSTTSSPYVALRCGRGFLFRRWRLRRCA